MIFSEVRIQGVYTIDLERRHDHRGFFARSWCAEEFAAHGLNPRLVQINMGFNHKKGTLRGMHFQLAPAQETKVVRCTRGAIYDVALDLRPDSPTFKQWAGIELSAVNLRMLYIPEGCAHGYQTLTNNAEMHYQTSQFHAADLARGVRYNDPSFAIVWPLDVSCISDADRSWPDYGVSAPAELQGSRAA